MKHMKYKGVFITWACFPDDMELHETAFESINEKVPPLKFRYFEKYKISFKNGSFINDSGQQRIDLETFNSSTCPGTMVHGQHVQFVIFKKFEK